jgi:hypothetical protein
MRAPRLGSARLGAACALGVLALGGCGAGTVTRTEPGPPHVTSVRVPVTVPAPVLPPAQPATAAAAGPQAPNPAPPSGKPPKGERKHGGGAAHDHGDAGQGD